MLPDELRETIRGLVFGGGDVKFELIFAPEEILG